MVTEILKPASPHLVNRPAGKLNQRCPLRPGQAGKERRLSLPVQERGGAGLVCWYWRAQAEYQLLASQIQSCQQSPDLLHDLPGLGGGGGHLGLLAVEQEAGQQEAGQLQADLTSPDF